jgi:predicted DNA-binding transcriptional regulator AlpA
MRDESFPWIRLINKSAMDWLESEIAEWMTKRATTRN